MAIPLTPTLGRDRLPENEGRSGKGTGLQSMTMESGRKGNEGSTRRDAERTDSKRGNRARRVTSRRRIRLILLLVIGGVLAYLMASEARRLLAGARIERMKIADVSSERLLADGSVVGFAADEETHAWLGIPFALPPVGDLRWRAPERPEAWGDTRDALEKGSPCPQLSSKLAGVYSDDPDGFAGSEDCLYLNVWAPRSEPDEVPTGAARLPVMVWIHGGGNDHGEGGASMYDGAQIAGRQDVVVVTFNYRLGPLGWFSHPALRKRARTPEEASGNFGTLDQIRALEWVQQNIAEFGGDPRNVTIFGESAGGTNVLALLLSPAAKGLFHRAISQSGSTDSYSRAEAEDEFVPHSVFAPIGSASGGHRNSSAEIVVSLLVDEGVVPDRKAARDYAKDLSDADLVTLLRSHSDRDLLDAMRDPENPGTIDSLSLIRDGVLLPEGDWLEEFRDGHFNAVPVLLGSNRDESKLELSQDDAHASLRFGILYRIRDPEDYERRARYGSQLWKVRAVDDPANAIHASGRTSVHAYRFDWDEEPELLGMDLSKLLGAAHGFEIPFVFFNFDLGDPIINRILFEGDGRGRRRRLGSRMMAYWAEFARTGRPGRGLRDDLPEWLDWSDQNGGEDALGGGRILIIDTEEGGGIRLASASMTRQSVVEAIEVDPTLDARSKCDLLIDLFRDRPERDLKEARRAWARGC